MEDYGDEPFDTGSPIKQAGASRSAYVFVCEVDGRVAGHVELPAKPEPTWDDFRKLAQARLGLDVTHVVYDDKFGPEQEDNIKCESDEDWSDVVVMMDEDDEFIKGKLTLRVFGKKAARAKDSPAVVSEALVRKVLLAKGKILEGCAAMDKSGVGVVTTVELGQQVKENIGCSAAEADALVHAGGAWREIVPNGRGQMIDYRMWSLRLRLVDKEEAVLLGNLTNPDLQAARMTVLTRCADFKEVLSECTGDVSVTQCEQLLKTKGSHLMGKKHVDALCADLGSTAPQTDVRSLPEELELIDTQRLHRSPLLNAIILGSVSDFASSNETKSSAALAASADGSSVLPKEKFCEVYEQMSADSFCETHSLLTAPAMPHTLSKTILNPVMAAATGALRPDLEVNFETFTSDLTIAHSSEVWLLQAGRQASLQASRRQLMKKRKEVVKELSATNTIEKFKAIIMDKPLSFDAEQADAVCADVPVGTDGARDALKHVQELQFSEILGTALDECSEALFAKYDELCSCCETKEASKLEGSISLDEFADAMDLVSVDSEKAKKVKAVLSGEGLVNVAWRELLESRMRALSWRELQILKRLRDKEEQGTRLKVLAAAARVLVSLADDAAADGLVPSASVKSKLVSVGQLTEAEADRVVAVLLLSPRAKPDMINSTDIIGFRSYIASREWDSDAMNALMGSRQGFLDACLDSEGASAAPPASHQTGPEVDATDMRSALHRVHLAAWAVDAVMGFADRAPADLSKVQVGALLSHIAVVTRSERRRLEVLADSRLQLARLALLKLAPTGDSCPKEHLNSLVFELIKQVKDAKLVSSEALQVAVDEGVALALLNMRDSYIAASKKGSLTSEDLVGGLSAVMCDFDCVLPFASASELAQESAAAPEAKAAGGGAKASAGGGAKAPGGGGKMKNGMTPGQRIFYEKLIKPRKPGIQEMIELMRGMPASIGPSPLRERQRSGHNMPSAALQGSSQKSPASVLTLSVHIAGAEGVPLTDKFEVLERRARVCLVHVKTKSFVSGAFTVPTSNKNDKGGTKWTFSKKEENGNPFLVRAPTDAEYELYIELALVTRKKGAKTEGQEALNNGDIKEFSAGFGSLRLNGETKAGSHNLPLFGGTPWGRVEVKPKDLEGQKRGSGFSFFKKPVSQVSIEVAKQKEGFETLPPALVCHFNMKEGLAEFCKLQKSFTTAAMFTRPQVNDVVLGTFPAVMDSPDIMVLFAKRWRDLSKGLKGDKAAAFRECVKLFYPLVQMDSSLLPKALDAGPNAKAVLRTKILDDFAKQCSASKEKLVEQLLGSDAFRGAPFRVDELIMA